MKSDNFCFTSTEKMLDCLYMLVDKLLLLPAVSGSHCSAFSAAEVSAVYDMVFISLCFILH